MNYLVNKTVYLFKMNFFISMFTFGGGYVVIPMMEKYFVNKGFLTKEELYDFATVAQTSPGAIAVNMAILVGNKIDSKRGVLVSGLASILPSFIILSLISISYTAFSTNTFVMPVLKGMEAGVAAIIIDLVITMYQQLNKKASSWLLIVPVLAFTANYIFNVHPFIIILTVIVVMILFEKIVRSKKDERTP